MASTQQMLCGDEVNATVIDIGSLNCRFGTAGQDSPRHVFRSDIAAIYRNDGEKAVGDEAFRLVRDNVDVYPLQASTSKWDDIERLVTYGYHSMGLQPSEYAAMFSRNAVISSDADLCKLMELSFEKLSIPAMYSAHSAVLSAFSVGRPTATVLDMGHAGSRIAAVIDGYALRKSMINTTIGGHFVDQLINHYINSQQIVIRPWFEAAASRAVPQALVRPSFRMLHVFDIVRDAKAWMCLVPVSSALPAECPSLPPPYELPDGTLLQPSYTLCTLPEQAFFPATRQPSTNAFVGYYPEQGVKKAYQLQQTINHEYLPEQQSLADLLLACLSRADADYRRDLTGNILLVGAGSLFSGLAPRLMRELSDALPSHINKAKLISNLNIEKAHSAWIGGSVLSIAGSFHQAWVSKSEYEEHGADRMIRTKLQH